MAINAFDEPGVLKRFFRHQFHFSMQQIFQRVHQADIITIIRFVIKRVRKADEKVNIAARAHCIPGCAAKYISTFHAVLAHELLYCWQLLLQGGVHALKLQLLSCTERVGAAPDGNVFLQQSHH